jgi:hypothetical protein
LRTAKAFGDMDEKRNLLINKPYDFAALCGPAVIRQRNYVSGRALASVHPKTPTLRTAKAFGDMDEKRNLLINKAYDFAALYGL